MTEEYYHIYNRSIDKKLIFEQSKDLIRGLDLLNYYIYPQKISFAKYKKMSAVQRDLYKVSYLKQKPWVEIYAYAVMPNHYHLLLKQISDAGVSRFISNFQNAFARYFNIKNERKGFLFQGAFKVKKIEKDEIFLHISRYIHLNPLTSGLVNKEELLISALTSLPIYIGNDNHQYDFVNTSFILGSFASNSSFEKFVFNQVDYQKTLKQIKDDLEF